MMGKNCEAKIDLRGKNWLKANVAVNATYHKIHYIEKNISRHTDNMHRDRQQINNLGYLMKNAMLLLLRYLQKTRSLTIIRFRK